METQLIEVAPNIEEKRQEIIDKLQSGEMVLSFSAIKEFAKSPAHFMAYKLGDKKQTAPMKKGIKIGRAHV